ncbi:hypothetical protein PB01_08695 [Psychrobacillus glaciei]|uniref:Uncharacterized protein n=1 Tax=Psychrobacillus glaciei TaxID=2283160 RepID=A0A5J6SQ36_9BACI|nr:hypothetical protein [Psychrobacillus glaciei]QFF98904.1 hypothetical protein PB01_08695 [Psychrobacillus glaciei]
MKSITKLLVFVGFTIFLFVFQSSFASAKDLSVIKFEKSDHIEDIVISEDSIINVENSMMIPYMKIKDGAEIVELNATVDILEVASKNKVVLNGKGNINKIIITTGNEVILNTTGNINKIEVINKDARLVVSEGTKIAKLIIPEGSKVTDIITNYKQAKDRFENISDGTVKPKSIPKPKPEPEPDPKSVTKIISRDINVVKVDELTGFISVNASETVSKIKETIASLNGTNQSYTFRINIGDDNYIYTDSDTISHIYVSWLDVVAEDGSTKGQYLINVTQ